MYLPEAAVLVSLNAWLGDLFDPNNIDRTRCRIDHFPGRDPWLSLVAEPIPSTRPWTYRGRMHSPITGTAAGVPFTALPPADDGAATLIITWHMLDAPRSSAAFAAALPMNDLPAWRVHLDMPMCGACMVDGSRDAVVELMRKDALMSFLYRSSDRRPRSSRPRWRRFVCSCRSMTARSACSAARWVVPSRCGPLPTPRFRSSPVPS
jgi:hypothetical protein